MSELNIHVNPHPKSLPPPYYRPAPGVTQGHPRKQDFIISGPLIDNEEGRRWFRTCFQYELSSDHLEDLNIPTRLKKLIIDEGIAFGCCAAPRRLDPCVCDFLVITDIQFGPFVNDGPDNYEEVLQEDLRPTPGVKDEEAKAWLLNELGKQIASILQILDCSYLLGIKTDGYKSYYTSVSYY